MTMHNSLLPDPLPLDPLEIAASWLADAWGTQQQPNPNAMVIATTSPDGRPSARVVLCKEIMAQPGYVTFFTNYESRKGLELAANPRAALVMHWDHTHRQVRIEGRVVKAPAAESDAYFQTRAWQRRIGAWASAQSQPLARREQLFEAIRATAERFKTPQPGPEAENDADYPVPRPPFWGGYRVWAESVELWVEAESRYHERARWTRTVTSAEATGGAEFAASAWQSTRLQP
jgi:pyridoxamine 5'-phosphate oxidase